MNGPYTTKSDCDPATMCHFKTVSWTAIFSGALIGIGLSFLLNLFNLAIGLTVFTTTQEGMMTLAITGFVGMIIGILIAMFLAGFTAGYLGRPFCGKRNLGLIYGFITWCVILLLTAIFTTHVGRYMASYSHSIAPTMVIIETDPNGMLMNKMMDKQANAAPATTTNMTMDKPGSAMGIGAFVVFIFFAIGALASCFGAHVGMTCRRCDT